jgi:streptogramin lyase
MKKMFLLTICFVFLHTALSAQTVRQLRKVTELRMPSGAGDNGGTVALNLKNRYYYATIAGNKTYSMAFFNGSGEMVSPPDLALMADIRGLWYSPVTKTFHGNAHGTASAGLPML